MSIHKKFMRRNFAMAGSNIAGFAWFSTFLRSWCSRPTPSASEGSGEETVKPRHDKPSPSCCIEILLILGCRDCSRIEFKGFLQTSLESFDCRLVDYSLRKPVVRVHQAEQGAAHFVCRPDGTL